MNNISSVKLKILPIEFSLSITTITIHHNISQDGDTKCDLIYIHVLIGQVKKRIKFVVKPNTGKSFVENLLKANLVWDSNTSEEE